MLITSWLGDRRTGGVLTRAGFEKTYGAVLNSALLTVEGQPRSWGISSVTIAMGIATAFNAPAFLSALGCFADPRRLPALRNSPACSSQTQFDELQLQIGFQLRNSGERNSIF